MGALGGGMRKNMTQLPLSLSLKDEATFENFYAGKNEQLITELKKTVLNQGEKVIYLCGIQGQGFSHLLQACCHYAHQHQISSVYLPFADLINLSPELLNGLESLQLICLDDLHVIGGLPAWEEAIFHLYNRVYDLGGRIVISANHLPKSIHIQLKDLVSRLSWGMVYQLHPLTDDEKLAIFMMRAKHRGIHLSEDIGKYVLTHCERDVRALFSTLDALDKASLAAQRRLTIPFVKEVLFDIEGKH